MRRIADRACPRRSFALAPISSAAIPQIFVQSPSGAPEIVQPVWRFAEIYHRNNTDVKEVRALRRGSTYESTYGYGQAGGMLSPITAIPCRRAAAWERAAPIPSSG